MINVVLDLDVNGLRSFYKSKNDLININLTKTRNKYTYDIELSSIRSPVNPYKI
jgi:hypothetical protein